MGRGRAAETPSPFGEITVNPPPLVLQPASPSAAPPRSTLVTVPPSPSEAEPVLPDTPSHPVSDPGKRPPTGRRKAGAPSRGAKKAGASITVIPVEPATAPSGTSEAAAPTPAAEAPAVELAPLVLAPIRQAPGFDFEAARAAGDAKLSTGVERLDSLLGGGYPRGSATLLFGPPFCGKQQLQQQAILRSARDGVHVTLLLHTVGAEAMSVRLRSLDPAFAAAEDAGLVRYVDVHSKALGEPTDHPHTAYVEDPHDIGGILQALAVGKDGARRPREAGRAGLLAIESASTVLIDLGAAKAFTLLRTVLGRTLTAGGVGLVCLEGGMHADSEVQMAKHLCAGMVEMRKKGEAYCLHVEGLETAYARPGWIEYEFAQRSFKVTGSFASRTIR